MNLSKPAYNPSTVHSIMATTIPATEVTLRTLKENFNLQAVTNEQFFPEWQERIEGISPTEQAYLERVHTNFLELLEEPPILENSFKMVVLAPLLDLAGFYRRPFRITTKPSIDIELEDEGIVIRGRIDVLVVNARLWLVVIESKRSDFAVTRALPQTLAYMLGNPNPERPIFGLITNGSEFLFLKVKQVLTPEYATSRLFSLVNPGNELYSTT